MKYKSYDVSKYKADPTLLSFGARTAHFLDWAAQKYPGSFFSANVILQGIQGLNRPPRSNAQECQSVRNGMAYAQKHLLQNYKRGLVYENGLGYRASTDSEDAMRFVVPKKAQRLNGAKNQLGLALTIVDPKTLPQTETGKQLKAYYLNLRDATKSLFAPEFEKRLMPPSLQSDLAE